MTKCVPNIDFVIMRLFIIASSFKETTMCITIELFSLLKKRSIWNQMLAGKNKLSGCVLFD